MKFVDGLMIHSGFPVREYVDTAVRHVLLRQGVLGIKVKIMLPYDPTGKNGPKRPCPTMSTLLSQKRRNLSQDPAVKLRTSNPHQLLSLCKHLLKLRHRNYRVKRQPVYHNNKDFC